MVSFLLSVASKNALKRKFDSILYHSPLDLLTNHIRFLYVKWLSKCMFSFFSHALSLPFSLLSTDIMQVKTQLR